MSDTNRLIWAAQDVGRLEYEIQQLTAKRERINERIKAELADLARERDAAAEIVRQEGGK